MLRTIAAACAAISLVVPAGAVAAPQQLTGTVRDFRGFDVAASGSLPRGHIDFENANGSETGIVGALGTALGGDGLPVYAKDGVASATTHGKAVFDQWYRDTASVNVSNPLTLTLTPVAGGYVGVSSSAFFPVDGAGWQALGAEPTRTGGHNFSFTTELHGELVYDPTHPTVTVGPADDDVWLYIDGKLRVDLGGVHGPQSATVDLSTLGLTAGRLYDLDLFQAERHTAASNLSLTLPPLGFDAGTATVRGAPAVGGAVACEAAGFPAGATLTTEWLRDDVPVATGTIYDVTNADAGHPLSCRVTGTRRTSATARSATVSVPVPNPVATPVVATPAPAPVAAAPAPVAAPTKPAPAAPACTKARTATLTLTAPRGTKLRSARATVGGKAVKFKLKGRTATAKLDLTKRPAGTTKVTIRGTTTKGRRVTRTQTFRVCPR